MFGEDGNRRTSLIVGIALAALLLVGGALFLLTRGRPTTPADIEALFERSPTDRDTARALKANFPADYQQMLDRIARVYRERGRQAAISEGGVFVGQFLHAKTNALIAAPDRELQRIGGAQVTLIHALRDENVNLCADYAMRGLRPDAHVSAPTSALISRLAVVIVEAARAGDQPGRAPRPTLSEEDQRAWFAAMAAIDPVATRQIEGNGLGSESPSVQCHAGVVLYEAAGRLPGQISANVTAYLVRESMNPSAPAR